MGHGTAKHRRPWAPAFIAAQIVGGAAGFAIIKALYPDVTAAEAADIIIPHLGAPTDTETADNGALRAGQTRRTRTQN